MINTSGSNSEFPITAIDSAVLTHFYKASESTSYVDKRTFPTIFRMLECFLQVTEQRLDATTLKSPAFAVICTTYIGALYSPTFIELSQSRRYCLARAFLALTTKLTEMFNTFPIPAIDISVSKSNPDVLLYVAQFERLHLNKEKLWLWEGWPCTNSIGRVYWAPLLPIYERLGRSFTEKFYLACNEYVRTRNVTGVPCLKELAKFINQYTIQYDEKDLLRSEFIGPFWRAFLNFYFINGYADGKGSSPYSLSSVYRNNFITFVESYLVSSGLFAEPWGEMPQPPIKSVAGANTNVRLNKEGYLVKEKLLTDIPLEFNDEVALQLLFKQIQLDVDIATQWATFETEDIWRRYQNRIQIAAEGQIVKIGRSSILNGKKWLIDRNNPDHLKNAAKTLTHHLHIVELAIQILPTPISQTAHELGLPITGALLPHCTILVVNHPEITPSYLSNLELFDKNGKQIGFVVKDGHCQLVGYKKRKGSERAQQIITLNSNTSEIVQQMITLTSSIREYLRLKNDDNWRYLILSCKRGFSYPVRSQNLAKETSSLEGKKKITSSLEKTSKLDFDQRVKYANRFSLTALRASCGVLVYLKTRSIQEMSKALGHTNVDSDLIHRYLPEPILAFFQERWIRIFQAAILVEALKDSKYIISASGFTNIHELDTFLKTHALKLPLNESGLENKTLNLPENNRQNEIVFGINRTTLTVMMSLQLAVQSTNKTIHEKAMYWYQLSKYLINHIESLETYRSDFQMYLNYARLHADPKTMESLIYV
jgi:hypothetical protein